MHDLRKNCEILGVTLDASIEEVKQSYRDLVKIWHPDRFNNDPRLQRKAQEKLKEINRAYNELCSFIIEGNNIKRENYQRNENEKAVNERGKNQKENDLAKKADYSKYFHKISEIAKETWCSIFSILIIIVLLITF
jgi:curved DNA-binding protein CbpA